MFEMCIRDSKWTISSDVGWIKFESPTEGNGNAIIRISVDKNTSEKELSLIHIWEMSACHFIMLQYVMDQRLVI